MRRQLIERAATIWGVPEDQVDFSNGAACHKADTEWEESPGEGTIYTWTVMRKSPRGPFALAYLELDEGPRVYVQFRPEDNDDLAIGKRAKIMFHPVQDDKQMMFAKLI